MENYKIRELDSMYCNKILLCLDTPILLDNINEIESLLEHGSGFIVITATDPVTKKLANSFKRAVYINGKIDITTIQDFVPSFFIHNQAEQMLKEEVQV